MQHRWLLCHRSRPSSQPPAGLFPLHPPLLPLRVLFPPFPFFFSHSYFFSFSFFFGIPSSSLQHEGDAGLLRAARGSLRPGGAAATHPHYLWGAGQIFTCTSPPRGCLAKNLPL